MSKTHRRPWGRKSYVAAASVFALAFFAVAESGAVPQGEAYRKAMKERGDKALTHNRSDWENGIRTSPFTSTDNYSHAPDWNLKGENLKPFGHKNPLYFPFEPGFKFILERPDHPWGHYRKEVTVLDKTEPFDLPGIGKFEAAVIQEEEFFDGIYDQQALNWFAYDVTNNSLYAFGEVSWEIDEEGNKTFDGSWRVGLPDGNGMAEAGMLMPGTFSLGGRYIFDGSESEAFGGTENIESGFSYTTPAGTFENCVRVREQSLTTHDDVTDKVWCRGIGLVKDTSDGHLIASSALPHTQEVLASFGQHHKNPIKVIIPPVAKVNHKEAVEIATGEVPGEVNSIHIERVARHNVYTVEIIAEADGVETDVFVDIESGEIVGTDR
jgi:uncharacterized membrane protein YkoI